VHSPTNDYEEILGVTQPVYDNLPRLRAKDGENDIDYEHVYDSVEAMDDDFVEQDLYDEPPSSPVDDESVIVEKINNILDIIKNGSNDDYNTLMTSKVFKSKTAQIITIKLYELLNEEVENDESRVEKEITSIYLEMMLRKQLEIDFHDSRITSKRQSQQDETNIFTLTDDKTNNGKSKFKPMNIVRRIKKNLSKRFKLALPQKHDKETANGDDGDEYDEDDDDDDDADNKYIDKVISINENRLLKALTMEKLKNKDRNQVNSNDFDNFENEDVYSIIDDREQLMELETLLPQFEQRLYPNLELMRNSLYDTLSNGRPRSLTPINIKTNPSTSKNAKNEYIFK